MLVGPTQMLIREKQNYIDGLCIAGCLDQIYCCYYFMGVVIVWSLWGVPPNFFGLASPTFVIEAVPAIGSLSLVYHYVDSSGKRKKRRRDQRDYKQHKYMS